MLSTEGGDDVLQLCFFSCQHFGPRVQGLGSDGAYICTVFLI
jgi:hypothetical protein